MASGVNLTRKMASSSDSFRYIAGEVVNKAVTFRDIFAIIGLAFTGKVALELTWKVLSAIRLYGFARLRGPGNLKEKYGPWAVVTGCTDGIGKEYAKQLASCGVNIVLISRSHEKLNRVAQELEVEYQVETHIIVADFSLGRSIYDQIQQELHGKEIGILINNVGVMYEYPMALNELPVEVIWQHVNINIASLTMMTWLVLPGMLQRKRGAVVNLSSSSAVGPLPYMNIYSASKKYVDYFSQALAYEYRNANIDIQTLIPFYVATNLTAFSDKIGKPNIFVPNAQSFVCSALCTLGRSQRTTGYWSHEVQLWSCTMVPTWVWIRTGALMQHVLRKDADKKRQAQRRLF